MLSPLEERFKSGVRGHDDAVVTLFPPTSKSGSNPVLYVGKVIVCYWWSAVYSTEP